MPYRTTGLTGFDRSQDRQDKPGGSHFARPLGSLERYVQTSANKSGIAQDDKHLVQPVFIGGLQ